MTRTIQGRMVLVFASFAVLILIVMGATFTLLSRQKDAQASASSAGHGVTLLQQMGREGLLLAQAGTAGDVQQAQAARAELTNTITAFETTLFALLNGGSAPVNGPADLSREIAPATTAEIRTQLQKVKSRWEPFKHNLESLLASGGTQARPLNEVLEGDKVLVEAMADGAALMQDEVEKNVNYLFMVQGVALAFCLLLVIIGGWVVRYTISKPIRRLAEAARLMSTGSLDVELRPEGTREIVDLSESFDRMRASMLAALSSDSMDRAVGDDDF